MSTTQRVFLQTPLQCGEGHIWLAADGPVAREDLQMIRNLLGLHCKEDGWPTLAEVRSYESCTGCEWSGKASDRVPREGEGRTGCPRCGAKTVARFSEPSP